ncbi:uncharacterized protein EI97DRAFT_429351 [Westerdykella ornata]|uniref:Sec20 C-terminal domain-containing protein n=1 Tax=Westerdykella ornata TaxID=318751 RepID=A0A6A6JXF5_WESOR|nr:uncharacterized protein EI97DRAFT_429351 [Westerdykella ornata]KAF2281302.1 hypothetical protein EI97DRAFT_429351 [Westerdykella ornata]
MPPIPTPTQTLLARLSTLSESNKATQQLIQRLAKLDFQPGTVSAGSEDGDARVELSSEIHDNLKQLDEEFEILRLEVEDVVQPLQRSLNRDSARRRDSARDAEKGRLAVLLARVEEDLKSSRTQFRKAQLAAKRNADRAKLKERELLFSSLQSDSPSTPPSNHRRRIANSNLTEQEVLAGAASDITAALRRTQALMQSELSRSRFAQETLEQSTAALQELGEKYTDLNTLLSKSRTLVTTLLKSQKSYTWYLETTLYILITTVIWLIFRRWLYGPITWFVVWPLKLVFRVAFAVIPSAGVAKSPSSSSLAYPEQPSTSLIVKPSATDKPPKFAQDHRPAYVPVGAGGRAYQKDPNLRESLSEKVGRMAEQSQAAEHPQLKEERQEGQEREQQKEQVVRGDGTVLPERGNDRPVNPKKKMWDESVEGPKHENAERERKKAEEAAAGSGGARRKRDEL